MNSLAEPTAWLCVMYNDYMILLLQAEEK